MSTPPTLLSERSALGGLAEVLRAIDAAARDSARLDEVLNAFVAMPQVFSAAIASKAGTDGASFVVAMSRGLDASRARRLLRTPLRRLFIRMKPSRIVTSADGGETLLAIPFSHAGRRCAVVAVATPEAVREYPELFNALESLTIPVQSASASSLDQQGMPEPSIVGLTLCAGVRRRLETALTSRGWKLDYVDRLYALPRTLSKSLPDIIAIDAEELPDALAAAASIHRFASHGPIQILAFAERGESMAASTALIDDVLPHDADSAQIFPAIKGLLRGAASLRRSQESELAATANRRLASIETPGGLAEFAAVEAAGMIRGWASCFLFDDEGSIYSAEYPSAGRPTLGAMPLNFLAGDSIFESPVSASFLDAVTSVHSERVALLAMQPLAGACVLPRPSSHRPRGGIVACATQRPAPNVEILSGLESFASSVTSRFDEIHSRYRSIPEFQSDLRWHRIRAGLLQMALYRSAEIVLPWGYEGAGEHGVLRLGVGVEGAAALLSGEPREGDATARWFVAEFDFAAQSMRYVSRGFAPPVIAGNEPRMAFAGDAVQTGFAALRFPQRIVLCDAGIAGWLHANDVSINGLPEHLERHAPAGVVAIVTAG